MKEMERTEDTRNQYNKLTLQYNQTKQITRHKYKNLYKLLLIIMVYVNQSLTTC